MEDSEKNLIKGLRAGHEDVYALLFNKYYRPLTVFATTYVNNLEPAREIVQDLFVSLYENRKSILIATSLKSYLYQSVKNRCLNYLKHLAVERKHIDKAVLEKELSEDLEARILETELEYKIFEIISELPPKCQQIFKMSRVQGLKNKEIAEKNAISIRTVETQISMALKALRENLGKEYLI